MHNSMRTFKERAHALVDELPDTATWYDLMFSAGERYDVEVGNAGSAVKVAEQPAEYGAEAQISAPR